MNTYNGFYNRVFDYDNAWPRRILLCHHFISLGKKQGKGFAIIENQYILSSYLNVKLLNELHTFICVFLCLHRWQKEQYKALIRTKRSKFEQKVEKMKQRLGVDGELLTRDRKLILSYPILDLQRRLKEGDLNPIDVLESYQVY